MHLSIRQVGVAGGRRLAEGLVGRQLGSGRARPPAARREVRTQAALQRRSQRAQAGAGGRVDVHGRRDDD